MVAGDDLHPEIRIAKTRGGGGARTGSAAWHPSYRHGCDRAMAGLSLL